MEEMSIAFLSSTSDLDDCRRLVDKAIANLGEWTCRQMDRFPASGEPPEAVCKRHIEPCDVFIGIVGYVYGCPVPERAQSFCEMEYATAKASGIDCLMFLASDEFLQPAAMLSEKRHFCKQHRFRQQIEQDVTVCRFGTPDELALQVVTSIHQWEKQRQREPADPARGQQDIIDRAIRSSLGRLPESPVSNDERQAVTGLDLSHEREFDDAGVALIRGLAKLEWLSLYDTRVSNSGLRRLAGLPLRLLNVGHTQVSDDGLDTIVSLTSLDTLVLAGTRVSNAELHRLTALERLSVLSLSDTAVSADGLSGIAGMPNLRELHLNNVRMSGHELPVLARFAALVSLQLGGLDVSGEGIGHIADLTNLRWLWLNNGGGLTNESVQQLTRLNKMEWLDISHTDVTDQGLRLLLRPDGPDVLALPELHTLGLAGLGLSSGGLEPLAGRSKLRVLSLWGDESVGNEGTQHLSGLANLQKLHLTGTQVSDAGLEGLYSLRDLRELDLRGTKVTKAGIERLSRALSPDCLIMWDVRELPQ